MLEKPEIQDQLISARAREEYGLQVAQITFLPLGADVNTAVYRLETADGAAYFFKLRKGVFDETSVRVPQFLHSLGIRAVIPPLETRTGQLWGSLEPYRLLLYPFIEAAEAGELSDRQWLEFGAALRGVHSAEVPPALKKLLKREAFSPEWREAVKMFQSQVEERAFDEPVAAKLAGFMRMKREQISQLVRRAEELALEMQAHPLELVLCHSDVHAGNLLIGVDAALYIVDWDNPILAPKERDLMFIGGGVSASLSSARGQALFYQGYGPAEVDRVALAYYRYERIAVDIAEFCKQLLLSEAGGEDREQSYGYFTSSFLPGDTIEMALRADQDLRR